MRAHLVQFDIAWERPEANFARVRELLSRTKIEGGDLVLLPELFDSGFSLNTNVTRDDGRTAAFLSGLSKDLGIWVQGGRTIAGRAKSLNIADVYGPAGAHVCGYAKIHPFSFGREPEAFEGGEAVETYAWGEASVCPAVCYDLRFPELFRVGALRGAEVIALGANWPQARQHHWRALLIARAIENQAVVLGVNRTGRDPHLTYAGGTIAVGAQGEVLGELGDEETILSVHVDVGAVRAWRERFPALRDARVGAALADEIDRRRSR